MGRLRDGGGVASDADWYYPRAPDSLKQLCRMWLQRIDEYDSSMIWPGLYLQESARLC